MNPFWANWKTTGAAVAIILIWLLKLLIGIEIPTEVMVAITTIVLSVGLFFAKDADKSGIAKILIVSLALAGLAGCSSIAPQVVKLDAENYEANKTMARETLKTWAFNSGFITCAGFADKMKFPIGTATEARAILQNSQITLGIAELDEISRRRGYWSDEDYDYGCSLGIKARGAALAAIDVLRLFPTLAPYLGAVFP